jgi:pimeloyl-ACP methyl ester carboxylesterase
MRIVSLLALLTIGLLTTACQPSFADRPTLQFADVPYTSLQDTPWPVVRANLPEVNTRFGLPSDTTISYVDLNPEAKQAVVLVHGLGSNLKFWRYQIDAFAKQGYRVIAPDMLGYGKSSKPASFSYAMPDMAVVLKGLLDASGVKNPILIGHSMGGQTVLSLAIAHPGYAKALVLTAPAGFETFSAREKAWFKRVMTTALIKSTSETGIWNTVARSNFYRWRDDYRWLVEERVRVRAAQDFDAYAYANVKSVHGLLDTEYTRGNLGRVKTPTLIIFGSADRLIPNRFLHGGPTRDVMQVGADGIKGARLVELARCGHTLQMDCHTEYNAEVLAFLKAR